MRPITTRDALLAHRPRQKRLRQPGSCYRLGRPAGRRVQARGRRQGPPVGERREPAHHDLRESRWWVLAAAGARLRRLALIIIASGAALIESAAARPCSTRVIMDDAAWLGKLVGRAPCRVPGRPHGPLLPVLAWRVLEHYSVGSNHPDGDGCKACNATRFSLRRDHDDAGVSRQVVRRAAAV